MTTWQKTVKYCALAFAILLAVGIISGIVKGIVSLVHGDGVLDEMQTHTIERMEEIKSLEIEVGAAELTVNVGDTFSLESNLKYLTVKTEQSTLCVLEDHKGYRTRKKTPKVSLIIPKTKVFETITLTTGAGQLDIESLQAKNLEFKLGAGAVKIGNLIAEREAKIEGGVGEIMVENATLSNLDFSMGMGKVSLTALLKGDNQLNCGVGEAYVCLLGNKDEYTVRMEKGIGDALIDGESAENGEQYGTGAQKIKVTGGIGKVSICFQENTQ